eukprot:gene8028-13938_t
MSYIEELDLDEEGLTEEEIKKRKTKIFVGGLKYSSKDDVLKEYFSQFGEIEEAVVIYDRESGLSKGYGFVTMSTDEAAELAIRDKSPRLDGRRCNVNLAYIGQKKKNIGLTTLSQGSFQGKFVSNRRTDSFSLCKLLPKQRQGNVTSSAVISKFPVLPPKQAIYTISFGRGIVYLSGRFLTVVRILLKHRRMDCEAY